MVVKKIIKGQLLISEPSILGDVSFNRSIVLLADHTNEGSVGFIVNKPLKYLIKDLIHDLDVDFEVYNGGPVEQDNLYFIHNVPNIIPNSIEIADGIYWGGDFELTKKQISAKKITKNNIRFFLGYTGWDKQQLEKEMESKAWIIAANKDESKILEKTSLGFWKEKITELGGEYLLWSNAPDNPNSN